MKKFMHKDFLLSTKTAVKLYNCFAADMPIFDYHCHVSPREIYEDVRFENITQAWLAGDHYKWRLMRFDGIDEYYITGDAPDREKFQKFAEALPRAIGNPMYHWCHLELRRYFGYEGILNGDTAEQVWRLTCEQLSRPDMSVRNIIKKSKVAFIGTTDDPTDDLEWHKLIKEDSSFNTVVAPSFRPDKALNLDKAGWHEYIARLAEVSGIKIDGIESLKLALRTRMEYFDSLGCRASDHGLDRMVYSAADSQRVDSIIKKALDGETVSAEECEAFKTELLVFCAEQYKKLDWVMQIHYNCLRNPNSTMFNKIGPDTGFDCICPDDGSKKLAALFDRLYAGENLPRTIIYSLNGIDNTFIDSLIGSFQSTGVRGTLQHGSAWWFNDTLNGMRDQMSSLAALGILGNFVGMLTDSRSFLSYTRHEYFRRILCELVGNWVEKGEYPADMAQLGTIIKGISFDNAKRFFKAEV